MMKKILLFIGIFVFVFIFEYVLSGVNCDEIWVYGFIYNIRNGLIIYRDFNIVVTPLYFFLGSLFLLGFGNYIISVDIFNAILISFIILFLYRMVGKKVFVIFPLFLAFFILTYNLLLLFFLFFIIYYTNRKDGNYDYLIAFIIGLMFITKQSVGVCLFIPYLFYSKHKIKGIVIFLIPFVIVSVYLLFNNAFYEFIDYCFLGLFDFGSENIGYNILTVISLVVVVSLIIFAKRSNFSNREVLYVLFFQIICYPTFDLYHCFMGYIPFLYLVLKNCSNKFVLSWLFTLFIILCFIFRAYPIKLIFDSDNILFMRNDASDLLGYINYLDNYISDNGYDGEYFYSTSYINYFYKLYYNIPIGQYDLMLSGNMGYHGGDRKFKELSLRCSDKRCLFLVDNDVSRYDMFYEFYEYIISNYKRIDGYSHYSFYSS